MEFEDLELELAVSSLMFLSLKEKLALRHSISSVGELFSLSLDEVGEAVGRVSRTASWNTKILAAETERSLRIMQAKGIQAVKYGSSDFPPLLGEVCDAPYMLFYRGNLDILKRPCVSVVGTRRFCEPCAMAAMEFSKDAALDSRTVVSGLAYGIDSFAHRGALSSDIDGASAAILPCGIETAVPYGNRHLAKNILRQGGCIAGEYPPGTPAEPWRFVQRNRIIAALAQATVVIQAPIGSGALITADFALDYAREPMFHKAAFCAEAKAMEAVSSKKTSKKKRSIENYVEEGAPVINGYAEFLSVLSDMPGSHSPVAADFF